MSRYVTVRVTQEDIDEGLVGSGYQCPIARAARRLGHKRAYVDGLRWTPGAYTARNGNGFSWCCPRWARLSKSARRFVRRFDNHESVQPATFRLPLP